MNVYRTIPVVAALVALAAGCGGPSTAPVTGSVTLEGQPVYPARVTFSPKAADGSSEAGGRVSSTLTNVDGTYSIEAAAIGDNVVGVIVLPADEDSEGAEDNEMPKAVGKPEKEIYAVTAGDNVIDIQLRPVAESSRKRRGFDEDD